MSFDPIVDAVKLAHSLVWEMLGGAQRDEGIEVFGRQGCPTMKLPG
jgi:hypothetical protein